MITVTEKHLQAIGFAAPTPLQAVQMVRQRITEDDVHVVGHKGVELINKLLGTSLVTADLIGDSAIDPVSHEAFELMVTQGVAETVVKNIGQLIDPTIVVQDAKARAMRLLTSPEHQWMFAKPASSISTSVQKAVVEGLDTKVAVTAAGKIKKGGKETLAAELYHQYVASLNGATYSNQAFISILVEKLQMTKSGATTYNYNMKRKFGGEIATKVKR